MKDLMKCSFDELLTEKQNAIIANNIERYRECNELISTMSINQKLRWVSDEVGYVDEDEEYR